MSGHNVARIIYRREIMKRLVPGLFAATAAVLLVASPQSAKAEVTQLRGNVVDAEGNPIPNVQITLEYKGKEPGYSNVFKVKTNKKGSWVRVGLPEGPYVIKFWKEGYQTRGLDYHLSIGGLSELDDIVLNKLAAGEKAVAPSDLEKAQAEAKKQQERIAKLGQFYQDAMTAIKAQEWDTAADLLRKVEQEVPDEALVHFNLAFVLVKRHDPAKKDLEAAAEEYRKVVELEPNNGEAIVDLAAVLEDTDRRPEAFSLLMSRNKDFQDDVAYQKALGAIALNGGNNDAAKTALTRVIELDPTSANTHYQLAGLDISDGNVKAGIEHLNKVVALEPADSPLAADAKSLLEALKESK
jgi:tetratricopeptide (TPR) repeat protein